MELVDERTWHCLEPFFPPPSSVGHVVPVAIHSKIGVHLMAFSSFSRQGYHGKRYQ